MFRLINNVNNNAVPKTQELSRVEISQAIEPMAKLVAPSNGDIVKCCVWRMNERIHFFHYATSSP